MSVQIHLASPLPEHTGNSFTKYFLYQLRTVGKSQLALKTDITANCNNNSFVVESMCEK